MLKALAAVGNRLLDALLPEECVVCERPLVDGERYVCLHCMAGMPRVVINSFTDNLMHATLASTRPLHRAAALFQYRKGSPYTRLVHHAKYNNRPRLARWLGEQLGAELYPRGFFADVDALIPVPLSRLKQLRRGYNQSREIAEGISAVTHIPVVDILKARHHTTQTRQNAMNRRRNATGVYSVGRTAPLAKLHHAVIIDDVVTTGSTLLECAQALRSANPSLTLSAASAALTTL